MFIQHIYLNFSFNINVSLFFCLLRLPGCSCTYFQLFLLKVLGVIVNAQNMVRLLTKVVCVTSVGEETSVIIQAVLVLAQTVQATEYVTL